MNNYNYKPNPVVAFQVDKTTRQRGANIPEELNNKITWTNEDILLKNPDNPNVLIPLKLGQWVVWDPLDKPSVKIYSEFKFEQKFMLTKKSKDAPKKHS